jgi:hypothetical protein
MRRESKLIAYPNIAYTICWQKEQFVEELIRKKDDGVSGYPGVLALQVSPALKSLFDSLAPYIKSDKSLSEVMKRHKLEEAIHILLEQEDSLDRAQSFDLSKRLF